MHYIDCNQYWVFVNKWSPQLPQCIMFYKGVVMKDYNILYDEYGYNDL